MQLNANWKKKTIRVGCNRQILHQANSVFSVAAEPTIQPEIDTSSVEGRNVTVRWRLPPNTVITSDTATGFLVQLSTPPPHNEKLLEETTLLKVLSTKFHNLEYHQTYTVVVRLVNCGSHGPLSKPYRFRINSQGNRHLPIDGEKTARQVSFKHVTI